MILPKHVTILVDTREKKPLPLPKTIVWCQDATFAGGQVGRLIEIRTEPIALYAGDYALKESPKRCIIERKGSINEVRENLCGVDRYRATNAFRKLCETTDNPILALDFPLTQRLYKGERDVLFTRLAQLCVEYRLQILSAGGGVKARHTLSDLVVRVLLAHYFAGGSGPGKDSPPCPSTKSSTTPPPIPLLNASDP